MPSSAGWTEPNRAPRRCPEAARRVNGDGEGVIPAGSARCLAYPGRVQTTVSPVTPGTAEDALTEGLDAWRELPAAQQPEWPDRQVLADVSAELATYPPLVFAGECDDLKAKIASAARGEAFFLQGGDCAETFAEVNADRI